MKTKKNYVLLFVVLLLALQGIAQVQQTEGYVSRMVKAELAKGVKVNPINPFEAVTIDANATKELRKEITSFTLFKINKMYLEKLQNVSTDLVELPLVLDDGRTIHLILMPADIFSDDFSVSTDKGPVNIKKGSHFRGIVREFSNSLAAVSVFDNDISGFFSSLAEGNYTFGKYQGTALQDKDVIIVSNQKYRVEKTEFTCGTKTEGIEKEALSRVASSARNTTGLTTKAVRIYYEANYYTWGNWGTIQGTADYLTALANKVQTRFLNDEIRTCMSACFIWTCPDPIYNSSYNNTLNRVNNYRRKTGVNGDVGIYLSTHGWAGVNGAAPYVGSALASINNGSKMVIGWCRADLTDPLSEWVTMHEIGHALGSFHTYECVWVIGTDVNNYPIYGAIENCPGFSPSCPISPNALSVATIMSNSYNNNTCFTMPIALANGFGPIVRDRIKTNVDGYMFMGTDCPNCLCNDNNSNIICKEPPELSVTDLTSTGSVNLNWKPVSNAANYTIEYYTNSLVINTITAPANTASYTLTGLQPSTAYYWRIRTNCTTGGSSPYNYGPEFVLANNCTNPASNLFANNLTHNSARLNWSSADPNQSFEIGYKKLTDLAWSPTLSGNFAFIEGTYFDLTCLESCTAYEWRIKGLSPCQSTYASGAFTTTGGAVPCIVPITITNFTATPECNNNRVRLNWRTTQEQNSSHFVVERSDDGSANFRWVKKIQAAGNSSIPRDYEFYDNYPVNGYCVYRIVAVDLDGSHIISEGRTVNQNCFDIIQPPTAACNAAMTGSLSICDNNSYYYTLTNVPDYTYINWSLWPSAQTAVTMTKEYSNKVKLVRNGSQAASLQLDATMTACNSGATVSKYILVGNPSLTVQTSNNLNPCTGVLLHHAWINTFPGTLPGQYTWYVAGQYYTTGSSISLTLQPGQNLAYTVSYNGPCGVSQGFGYAQNGGQDPIPERQVKISPNPSTGNFTLSVSKIIYPDPCRGSAVAGSDQIVQVEILDKLGNRKAIFKSGKQNTVNISANKLTPGVYMAKVYTADGAVLTEKLMVSK